MTKRMNWERANRERRVWDRGVSNVADESEWFERDPAARWLGRSQPGTKPTRKQQRKPKRGNGKTIVIPGDGDPCPRCGVPMQIREHNAVSEKQLRQSYYTRWFCCMNKNCQTKQVMPPEYKVINSVVGSGTWPDNTVMQPEPADPNERPPWE